MASAVFTVSPPPPPLVATAAALGAEPQPAGVVEAEVVPKGAAAVEAVVVAAHPAADVGVKLGGARNETVV